MENNFYSENIGYEPQIDLSDNHNIKLVLKNGSPNMINELKAIEQWIVKFCSTEKDAYSIYEGLGFGTRIKTLFGHKRFGYGYEEAEIERDFREGLPLCPAISQVTNFELEKIGRILNIKLEVELINGESLNINIDDVYTL